MNRFAWIIAFHVWVISLSTIGFTFVAIYYERYIGASIFVIASGVAVVNLIAYVNRTNRKLTRLVDAIQYEDFELQFIKDDNLGKSFRQLNQSLNRVINTFKDTRAQSEAHLHYLHTIVQHVQTGIIAYDEQGNVTLYNPAAAELLQIRSVTHLADLKQVHPHLVERFAGLQAGGSSLYTLHNQQLILHTTAILLRKKRYSLIAIQDIHLALQAHELAAWQKLAATLRHEIVNSVTPIVSIIHTLQEITEQELAQQTNEEVMQDIREALHTIDKRGNALVRFVNAYQHFTRLPSPNFSEVDVSSMFQSVQQLIHPELRPLCIQFDVKLSLQNLKLMTDQDLLEMALLNLIKNAKEALHNQSEGKIELAADLNQSGKVRIIVADNGPGMSQEVLSKAFIPFFSTKSHQGGTGIGLSITRQIIHSLKGNIEVASQPELGTRFMINFW